MNNHVTKLEIDVNALGYNFNYLKAKAKSNIKTLASIKAYGYGLDDIIIAKHLEKMDVDYFGVAYADEGIRLRNHKITKPILILHPQTDNFQLFIDYQLEPNLYSLFILKKFIQFLDEKGIKNYPVHLKFNSGMNRLGMNISELNQAITSIQNTESIKVISVFSHIAASEDLDEKDFTKNQINTFKEILTQLRSKLSSNIIAHLSNTSGVINFPEAHFDMIRMGIGLYGFGNATEETKRLKNIATLKSKISLIRTIQKGEKVSYNMAFTAQKEERIAIVPIGHADGFSRPLGCGNGYVKINNQKAYTTGNVCMDMILVNVTNINCQEGDEVIIFDNQETVEEFASICNTISYEILTAISQRIKRTIKQ